ncbi:gonadal somatic cell derived factor [Megalops cyprinoides]|uniref:gonadal somatic cell derived factor n=1 Tax=Megalops cyprinoides TaxID=118141 RepID=UPI0018651AEE|nr:gonadal somatic cell derived factor [Megalops cyprinoides]
MLFVLCVMALLFGFPLGEAFVLHPSQGKPTGTGTSISDMPVVKANRCQGESLQAIKQKLLKALNLDQEPQVSSAGLPKLRAQWKAAFEAASQSSVKSHDATEPPTKQNLQHNRTSTPELPENQDIGNNTGLHCYQLVSQIFITDLGWESWVIYPETFTYTQCTVCTPNLDLTVPRYRTHSPPEPGTSSECCQPTSQELVPFIYMDEFNTLVISSVHLARGCSCKPGPDHQPVQN